MKRVDSLGSASRGSMRPRASCTKASSNSIASEWTVGANSGSSLAKISSNCTKRRGLSDLKGSPEDWYSLLHALQSSPTTKAVSMAPLRTLGRLLYFSSVTSSPFLS